MLALSFRRAYSTGSNLLSELRAALISNDSATWSLYSQVRRQPHLFSQLRKNEFRDLLCSPPASDTDTALPVDEVIADMRNHPFEKPNTVEYNLLAASHVSDWSFGDILGLLGTMRSEGVKPDEKTYEHLVKTALGRKDLEGAERLVATEMPRDGVKGTPLIYGTLSEEYVRRGQKDAAERVLRADS